MRLSNAALGGRQTPGRGKFGEPTMGLAGEVVRVVYELTYGLGAKLGRNGAEEGAGRRRPVVATGHPAPAS